jgi:hypothetical protein
MAVTLKGNADVKNILKEMGRLEREMAKLGKENQKLKETSKKATIEAAGGFGKLKKSVIATALSFGTAQGAITLFKDAIRAMRHEIDGAKTSLDGLLNSRILLNQVALDEADKARLNARAEADAGEFGISREKARLIQFQGRSQKFEKDTRFISRTRTAIDPLSAAKVGGQLRKIFEGDVTLKQAVNLGFVASGQSRLNFEELGQALPIAAEGAALTGTSAVETLALAGVLPDVFASGQTAGARIRGLGTALSLSKKFGGKGILGGIEALEAAPEAERKKFLGESQERNQAFQLIGNARETIRERIKLLEKEKLLSGTPQSALNRAIVRGEKDPAIGGVFDVRAARNRAEFAVEKRAGGRGARGDIAVAEVSEREGEINAAIARGVEIGFGAAGVRTVDKFINSLPGGSGSLIGIENVLKDIRDNQKTATPAANPEG